MIDIKTGKEMSRGNFLKGGLAAIIASGSAPWLAGSANASVGRGMMRNVGARNAAMFGGGGWKNPYIKDGLLMCFDVDFQKSDEWIDSVNGIRLTRNGDYYSTDVNQTVRSLIYDSYVVKNTFYFECVFEANDSNNAVFAITNDQFSTVAGVGGRLLTTGNLGWFGRGFTFSSVYGTTNLYTCTPKHINCWINGAWKDWWTTQAVGLPDDTKIFILADGSVKSLRCYSAQIDTFTNHNLVIQGNTQINYAIDKVRFNLP